MPLYYMQSQEDHNNNSENMKHHIGSRLLEHRVEREYERKGYSKSKSKYIGGAVAGKVYREQMCKKPHSLYGGHVHHPGCGHH